MIEIVFLFCIGRFIVIIRMWTLRVTFLLNHIKEMQHGQMVRCSVEKSAIIHCILRIISAEIVVSFGWGIRICSKTWRNSLAARAD